MKSNVMFIDGDSWYVFRRSDGFDVIQEGDEVLAPTPIGHRLEWRRYLPSAFGHAPSMTARRKVCSFREPTGLALQAFFDTEEYKARLEAWDKNAGKTK